MARVAAILALGLAAAACGGGPSGTTAAVPLERASDLVVVAVTFLPAAPRAGERVAATVQWADLAGDTPFPVPITIDLVVEPETLGRVCSWETVQAAGTVDCVFDGWDAPGTYHWDAWADTLRVVEEPSEGNNTLGGTITVEG